MIVYNRIDKVIIIPECGCPSSGAVPHSKCEREVQIAYASGYTAGLEDCSGGTGCELQEGRLVLREDWLGPETVYPDLMHNGFSKFVVIDNGYGQEKWYEGYAAGLADASGASFPMVTIQLVWNISDESIPLFGSGYTAARNCTVSGEVVTVLMNVPASTRDFGYGIGGPDPVSWSVNISTDADVLYGISYELPFSGYIDTEIVSSALTWNVHLGIGRDITGETPIISSYIELVDDGEEIKWYRVNIRFMPIGVPNYYKGWQEGYAAGIQDCSGQSFNNVLIFNVEAGGNRWIPLTQRNLRINGILDQYPYTIDGAIGYEAQFNLFACSQIPTPQTIEFTIDIQEFQTIPNLGVIGVFGTSKTYTYTTSTTTGQTSGTTGVVYNITITGDAE